MRVLVTGGSGFLGSALARYLATNDNEVAVLLREESSLARLQSLPPNLQLLRFKEWRDLPGLFVEHGPDAVVHTACSYGRRGESLAEIAAANTGFGLALLDAALASNTRLFINTDTVLDRFTSPYALSKKQFSEWGAWYGQQQKFRFVNVLLQHMYGAGDDASKFTSHVIRSCRDGAARLALTPGQQQRDFIYIRDVVSAYDCLLRQADSLGWSSDVELGSGMAPTIEEFVRLVHRITGSSTSLEFSARPYRPGEPMRCVADISLLRSLGWQPSYTLEEGVLETLSLELSK